MTWRKRHADCPGHSVTAAFAGMALKGVAGAEETPMGAAVFACGARLSYARRATICHTRSVSLLLGARRQGLLDAPDVLELLSR